MILLDDHHRRGGGRGTHVFLALAIWPLTTHFLRDGTPSLLLPETPSFGGASSFVTAGNVCGSKEGGGSKQTKTRRDIRSANVLREALYVYVRYCEGGDEAAGNNQAGKVGGAR